MLQITTVAKQTISKAWKTRTLILTETSYRINQAMVHAKTEAITDKKFLNSRIYGFLGRHISCLLISMQPY